MTSEKGNKGNKTTKVETEEATTNLGRGTHSAKVKGDRMRCLPFEA
jgi:hypothetical protein